MDRQDAVLATAQKTSDALDIVLSKAAQLESLLALMTVDSISADLLGKHQQNICWLGRCLAAEIAEAAARL
ncbi:hypothetical protein B0G76_2828 [Paraburkholderia sp. BL23I1N1]|uniref:hypothetical protein n=1 Tax=Paraburkholderia sp. BL23I1N1 TaxID=1938802 RepID=UPI000E73EEC1|nr:hypothetical protein [Paraburkholderia sp. BL23I1N1]RKE36626.1 hypothetical protein B0G76_2828 [Paraburkholderia sp. BL23I1N1]